jgi:hypothetical protein
MSDHEFENYLALLSKLLRLDGQQRELLAGELRSHLEDRLDELLARGVPRHEAVRLALEEFGDAAGLASEFASIVRNRRKRWIMRATTISAAAMVLVALGIATFWPGRNAGPGVAQVIAQEEEADKAEAETAIAPAEDKDVRAAIDEKLNERIPVEFVELPLKDAFQDLSKKTGLTFYIKAYKLEEAGISIDTPVTIQFANIRLSTFLDLALDELQLTWMINDDIIVITSPEDAESVMEVRVYDCRDLLAMPAPGETRRPAVVASPEEGAGYPSGAPSGGFPSPLPARFAPSPPAATKPAAAPAPILPQAVGGFGGGPTVPRGAYPSGGMPMPGTPASPPRELSEHERRAERLMDLITTAVEPDQWDAVGGPGSISEYNGLIVIAQVPRTHKKVEQVLQMLREAAGLEFDQGGFH